jgi:hypothetical protein
MLLLISKTHHNIADFLGIRACACRAVRLSDLLAGMTTMPPTKNLLAIVRRIAVEQIPDYLLILTSMFLGNVLEEVNARLTQIESYLNRILLEDQFFRSG